MLHKAILFLASFLISTSVAALGLGDMDLKSGLNEPLNAEIELLSVAPDEIDGIKVSLASSSDFERIGVERLFLLTKLKFKVTTNADGKAVIRITSKDSFREPFIDLVIEVNWDKGRMLREYTALVDPPVFVTGKPAPVAAPAVVTPAPIIEKQEAMPVVTPASKMEDDDELFPRIPIDDEPARAPVARYTGDSYGPTKRTDTLWSVASKVRRDHSVSVEQTMLAITKKNPRAFTDGNINTLRQGYILRLPNRNEVTALSKSEALRITREHHRRWAEMRGGSVLRATPGQMADSGKSDTGASVSGQPVEPRLKVLAGKAEKEKIAIEGKGDGKGELQKQIQSTTKAAETVRKENESLQGQVKDLEEKLAEMERAVSIKDRELAALQESVERGESVADKAARSNKTKNPYVITEAPKPQAPKAEIPKPAPKAPIPQPKVITHPTPAAPSLIDEILNNPLMLAAAVAVALLLGALIWMLIGKQRVSRMKMDFQESILTGKPVSEAPTVTGASDSQRVDEDSSFLSDFSVSGIEGIQTDVSDVDPLAEADVYVAYGRHKQAEELIKGAIESEPERHDLRVKLIEIHYADKNKDAFEAQAEELYAVLGGQAGPMWDKVVSMGADLCPDNPLFSEAAVVPAAPAEPAEEPQDEVVDIGLGDVEPEQESEFQPISDIPEIGADELPEETAIDSGFGEALEETAAEASEEEDLMAFDSDTVETAGGEDLDFDLDLDETQEEAESTPGESVETAEAGPEDVSDLDFALDESAEDADAGKEQESSEVDGGFFTEEDEVSTKLDLAKAYIDMGDPDGARSILDEVLEEGDDQQKQEANELMQQIS